MVGCIQLHSSRRCGASVTIKDMRLRTLSCVLGLGHNCGPADVWLQFQIKPRWLMSRQSRR